LEHPGYRFLHVDVVVAVLLSLGKQLKHPSALALTPSSRAVYYIRNYPVGESSKCLLYGFGKRFLRRVGSDT
jgi:hypothetical protein